MGLDYRNTNTLWASVLVETLAQLGLDLAVLCPGSRSTPLTVAFAQHPAITAIPILDERSAAFFALGAAQRSHRPTVLVCTSGTAGANFYPAVIEAAESRVPLIVLTADRPPELRDCHAGQTVDQQKLYGGFPRWYHELMVPTGQRSHLAALRQTMIQAWQRALYPVRGAVHLNCPFRDPLAPIPDPHQPELPLLPTDFFAHVPLAGQAAIAEPIGRLEPRPRDDQAARMATDADLWTTAWTQWRGAAAGVIIAGVAQPADAERYCRAIAQLSAALGWPVLAEALSPLRNYASLNAYLVSTYDWILRNPDLATRLAPDQVIQLGPLPTSKVLRQWLSHRVAPRWVIDPGDRAVDPLHGHTIHLPTTVTAIAAMAAQSAPGNTPPLPTTTLWLEHDAQVQTWLTTQLAAAPALIEPQIAALLSQQLPTGTRLFVANSMPVRDLEWFWQPGDRQLHVQVNRGANGIDGTLSTALGMAYAQPPSVLLTGDLACLHDTNGLLLRPHFVGQLTIIVINNHGGGIFELLPIAAFDPPFNPFFTTPQSVDWAALCRAYGVEYACLSTVAAVKAALTGMADPVDVAKSTALRLWEIPVNRTVDMHWRKQMFQAAAIAPWLHAANHPNKKA